jgi:hypothetical protein
MRHTLEHRQTITAGASSAASLASYRDCPLILRRTTRRLLVVMTGAALAVSLSGCVNETLSENQPGPAGSAAAAPSAAGSAAAGSTAGTGTPEPAKADPLADTSGPPPAPGTGAAAAQAATDTVRQTVTDALGRLAAGTPKPATAQVTDALVGAGITPGVLEVSQSRTPTGLEADAIEAAVRQGNDCVIGQVRDGAVAVTVLPVLASGKCFVGS